jgi:hypothetical protein
MAIYQFFSVKTFGFWRMPLKVLAFIKNVIEGHFSAPSFRAFK